MKKSWIRELPLLLLLLAASAAAQSGDSGESEEATNAALESRISCWSHITTNESSLTCQLAAAGGEDDEDHDAVEQMSICLLSVGRQSNPCLEVRGNTITDNQLHPVVPLEICIQLKSRRRFCKILDLKKIVRPRAPHVQNVTFSQASNQVLFHIGTPYQDQYLRSDNQLFQLHIWTSNKTMVQNTSSQTMSVDLEHLRRHAHYNVRVRSIPVHFLSGSWSSWSAAFSFSTPRVSAEGPTHKQKQNSQKLTVCVIVVTLLTLSFVFFKKNKIFSYVWPSIPSPKPALVQICRPSKALLLHFKPDEFSALKIDPRDATDKMEGGPMAAATADPGSAPSSGCSASTEELELSALLSGSEGLSGSGSGSGPGPGPASAPGDHPDPRQEPEPEAGPGPVPGPAPAPSLAAGKMEEAYVTMSSFYQIK